MQEDQYQQQAPPQCYERAQPEFQRNCAFKWTIQIQVMIQKQKRKTWKRKPIDRRNVYEIQVTLVSKESFCPIICKALLTARSQSTLLGMLWLLDINVGGVCFGNFTMEEETCTCVIRQHILLNNLKDKTYMQFLKYFLVLFSNENQSFISIIGVIKTLIKTNIELKLHFDGRTTPKSTLEIVSKFCSNLKDTI